MRRSVLIVDDEETIRQSLSGILKDEGFEIWQAEDSKQALKILEDELPDLVFLDIWLPGKDGMETLRKIKEDFPQLQVIMISGHGNIETAVKTIKLGAYDFIEKPLSLDKVLLTVNRAFNFYRLEEENVLLRQKIQEKYEITGQSKIIAELKEQIKIAAPTNAWILIQGENGTGKELVARMIHNQSLRANKPFVEVNCAAIPEELIESELFGHEKGAFTGALFKKRGKFDLANEGTLFLDEIGDMSLKTQAKILRILQEQKFERVGGSRPIEVDVRVIAATNKNLLEEINKGNFREDLYYRINVIPFEVPPLKKRREDVPLLVEEFLLKFSRESARPLKEISPEALEIMMRYNWPGNVRELKNLIERLVIMTKNKVITPKDLPSYLKERGAEKEEVFKHPSLKRAKEEFEKRFITKKLEEFNENISKTADAIGIGRIQLHRKIRSLGIEIEK